MESSGRIKNITFEEIRYYWERFLWPEYPKVSHKIDIFPHKNYCYTFYRYISQENLEKIAKITYIGYFLDNKIVGVVSGYRSNKDYYRLRGLWIIENLRRQGIASELVRFLEKNCEQKYLWTTPRSTALPFYLNYGFIVTGSFDDKVYGKTYVAKKEKQ